MPDLPQLSSLDLTALVASRVCHDIISPCGAVVNGLEVLEEEGQSEDMRDFAMDLIRKSANSASAKLKFSRLAFGASGSAGSLIDSGEAQEVATLYMEGEKADLIWNGARTLIPKNRIKLLLNLLLIALGSVPRGGTIDVTIDGEGETATFDLVCTGPKARVPAEFVAFLNGTMEQELSAHIVQPYYTILLAQECGLELSAKMQSETIHISAK